MTTEALALVQTTLEQLTNAELAEERRRVHVEVRKLTDHLGYIDQQIHTRMDLNLSEALTDDNGEIIARRLHPTPKYDPGKMVELKEALPPSELKRCLEFKEVWRLTPLNSIAKSLGKVAAIMANARLDDRHRGKLEFPDV